MRSVIRNVRFIVNRMISDPEWALQRLKLTGFSLCECRVPYDEGRDVYSNWLTFLQYDDHSINEVSRVTGKKGNTFTLNLHLPALKMVNFTKPGSGAQFLLTRGNLTYVTHFQHSTATQT